MMAEIWESDRHQEGGRRPLWVGETGRGGLIGDDDLREADAAGGFPPAQLFYILYRRLAEQGLRTAALWVKDKVVRRMHGYSPTNTSARVAPHLFVGGQQDKDWSPCGSWESRRS